MLGFRPLVYVVSCYVTILDEISCVQGGMATDYVTILYEISQTVNVIWYPGLVPWTDTNWYYFKTLYNMKQVFK
jgi:hypothetical protein